MKTDEIRQRFLDFFKSKGHEIVPSDSLIPKDDPTLLFTGAGMNQFKEKFLGRGVTYRRAASCQKCLRTGDLENVGRTPSHHTFFEMLGNFSFGDYFKKEAIEWAWEFLTKDLKLKPENLWVSVYKDDKEAYGIWKDIMKVPAKRIMKFGAKENFWPSEAPSKGPNGPCGPCSEIFYDWGKKDLVEVWNLVFTQFDRQPDGTLKSLPNRNIDTGMGLERIASVMQGVRTNFEIDIFKPLVAEINHKVTRSQVTSDKLHINAIADHIRAVTFAITDGVMPSNIERGYVVRKLIRRARMHCKEIGINEPFLYKLVCIVADVMGKAYPELKSKRDDIAQVVKKEEESFLFVLNTQLPRLEKEISNINPSNVKAVIAGTKEAFIFYDTYGVPLETIEFYMVGKHPKVDKKLFDKLRDEKKELSRKSSKIKSEIFSETFEKKVASLGLKTEFLGYEKAHAEARIMEVLPEGEVILDKTPFYGESGGQVGDRGTIETDSGLMEVMDAKKIGDAIVHVGEMKRGKILKGEFARVEIDEDMRRRTMLNHTATHLLQAALKKALGDHVRQTGSLVDAEHLRFDFTHMKKLDERELARVEEIVNSDIEKAIPVAKELKNLEAAKREGALALFGEKYDKRVRVVSIGDVSKELCGGTHVDNTKEIGIFVITSESSTASGVRRIEAVTGAAALEWMKKQEEAEELRLKGEKKKEEEGEAAAERLKRETSKLDLYISKAEDIGGIKVISAVVPAADMEILRILSDRIREKEKRSVIILAAKGDEKVSFVISVAEELAKKKTLNASDLAKDLARSVAGSGGGRPDFAQGGGKDPAKLDGAMRKLSESLKEKLK